MLQYSIIIVIYAVNSDPPRRVLAFALCSAEIQVIWTEISETDLNGNVTHYEVIYEPLSDCLPTLSVNTTNITVTLTDLEEIVEYNISVRAHTIHGPGFYSEGIITKTIKNKGESQ